MSISQHNQLMKVVFDGSKHLNHVMTTDEIRQMTMIEQRFPLTKLPVCGHCEKLAYWSKSGAYCPKCGTITKNPVTYADYLASGFDVDQTGETFRSVAYKNEMKKREIILPKYGGM